MARGKILIVYKGEPDFPHRAKAWLDEAGWDTVALSFDETSTQKIISQNSPDILILEAGLYTLSVLESLMAPSEPGSRPAVILFGNGGGEGLPDTAGHPSIQGFLDYSWGKTWIIRTVETAAELHSGWKSARTESNDMKTLLARCPGLIYRSADYPTGKPFYVGGTAEALTGWSPEDLTRGEVSLVSLIVDEDRRLVGNSLNLRMSRKLPYELEFRIRDRDGRIRWIRDAGAGVFTYDGLLRFAEGFWMDITESRMQGW